MLEGTLLFAPCIGLEISHENGNINSIFHWDKISTEWNDFVIYRENITFWT